MAEGTGSFAALVRPLVPEGGRPVARATLQSAPLAHLDYQEELRIKDEGLRRFWEHHRLPGTPEQTVASPRPRRYRTTSSRRCQLRGSTLTLVMGDKGALSGKRVFLSSPLEPLEHERIYTFLQKKLSEPAYQLAAAHLNSLIIRGSYRERVVIFNIDTMNGPLIRKLKMLAAHLQKQPGLAAGAFIYPDPGKSSYYLESRRPSDMLGLKKLYGPDQLAVTYGECRYCFSPTSFSQVNESMVEVMLGKARELLVPEPAGKLLDLYCGYGLFSHFLAPDFREVVAVDAEGPSIRAAKANGLLNRGRGGRTTFLAHRISARVVDEMFGGEKAPTAILLDPPRQGPQAGVIPALSDLESSRVLHIFCGIDTIPAALTEWRKNGYLVKRIVPLDMFPGTVNIEVLILLGPKKK